MKKWCGAGAIACLAAFVVMSAGTAAQGGEAFLAVSPSVNLVRITGGSADKRSILKDGTFPESSLFDKRSDTDTALGVGIAAGVSLTPNWQLGLGYEFIGDVDYESRGALGYDIPVSVGGTGSMSYADGYYTNRIGDFDFHNIQLMARYNFLTNDCRFNVFATARAGVSFINADMKADVYGGLAQPYAYEYTQFQESKTKAAFSYGIGLGVQYKFTPKISGELAGEFFQVTKTRITDYSGKVGAIGGKLSVGLGIAF